MANLDNRWEMKFARIGWRRGDIQSLAERYLGKQSAGSILGVIETGDRIGNLLGVGFSHVVGAARLEETLVGFTIGGENSAQPKSIIRPEERIPGYLLIAPDKFIACGREIREFPYSQIIAASGDGRTVTAANYDLQIMGIRDYSYSDEIYAAKFELNRQDNLNCGYDALSIAFVAGSKVQTGDGQGNILTVWSQLERTIITGEA